MVMKKDLIRFIKQDDNVSNAIWFLRKLEWHWSVRAIGRPKNPYDKVLDVASEVRVSHLLFKRGWDVWRLDFSWESARRARIYGPRFSGHLVIDASRPKLPFCPKGFDSAVCVGPFDFKFLDKEILLTEVKDSLKPGGKFVFSLPTSESQYCNEISNKKFHFWSSEEVSKITKTWEAGEIRRINIPQPSWVYSRIINSSRIPTPVFDILITKPLTWLCPHLPNRFGSYIIFSLSKRVNS